MRQRPSETEEEERDWPDAAADAALAADVDGLFPAGGKPSKAELLEFKAKFPAIYRKCSPLVSHRLWFWGVHPEDRPDLHQDTFETFYRRVEQKGAPRDEEKAIAAIAWRLIANHLRRRKRRPPLANGVELDNLAGRVDPERAILFHMDATAAAGRLSEQDTKILVLLDIEGLSYKAVAEQLGIPVGTVGSRASAARQRFSDDADPASERGQKT